MTGTPGRTPSDGYDTENMLEDEPQNINATTDNELVAGIIPDERLPVPPTGGSIDQSDERNQGDDA